MNTTKTVRWTTVEPFQFVDGIRFARLTWEKTGMGERQCVQVDRLTAETSAAALRLVSKAR